uniref:Uncharacterized protein n=1 Tax=Rhizophora mucronata TaxID=61149 RepID=A0A2P2N1D0_RHIMU
MQLPHSSEPHRVMHFEFWVLILQNHHTIHLFHS